MRALPLLFLAFLVPARPGPRAAGRDLEAAADAYLAPLRALHVFRGVVLVARGDSVLFRKAYGRADLENEVPLTTRSVFRVASITKGFTRALAGRLAERGLVDLDAPIARWLPGFPDADRITLRLLLDHRAGVPNVNSLPYDEEALAPHTLAQLVDSIAKMPLDFEPGAKRSYSNGGYAVATRILELAAGRPYGPLLEDEILRPLGLGHTHSESDGEIVPGRARGYAPSPVAFGRTIRAPFQEMVTKTGGGSLVSTAADLHRWALAVGHAPVLGPATWADLFPDGDSWAETGRCPGYNAALVRDGDRIAVVLANDYAAGMTYDVARALIDLSNGREPEPLPVTAPAAADSALAAAIPGSYRPPQDYPLPPGASLEVHPVDGNLVAYLGDAPVDVLVPQGGRSFLLRSLWSLATFEAPVAGRSPAVVIRPLYREGSYRATRVATGDGRPGPGDSLDAYVAALRFYEPPFHRPLWIDGTRLAGDSLEPSLYRALLGRVPRARPWRGRAEESGSVVRLSALEPAGPDAYRVIVRYRYVSPWYRGSPSDQWLLVRKSGGRWRIASRGAVASR